MVFSYSITAQDLREQRKSRATFGCGCAVELENKKRGG